MSILSSANVLRTAWSASACPRPQIVKAARSDNPEQRTRQLSSLRSFPGGGPMIRTMRGICLSPMVATAKRHAFSLFFDLAGWAPRNAHPSFQRRTQRCGAVWRIAGLLSERSDVATAKRLRNFEPPADDPPALFLAGQVWIDSDRDKGLAYLRRAINSYAVKPSSDGGFLTYAFRLLIANAIESQDYNQAAALLRKQVPRKFTGRPLYSDGAEQGSDSSSLALLAALHQYFGPLGHYAWDVQTWSLHPKHASLLAGMGIVLAPLGFAPPLPTGVTSGFSSEQHAEVGEFFFFNGFADAAEIELRSSLGHAAAGAESADAPSLAMLALIAGARR